MTLRTPLLVAACLVACSGSDEAAIKQSAAQVARAVERLRGAPNSDKAVSLAQLSATACTGADVCEMRAICAAGYGLHVDSLALTQAAKLQLATGKALEAAKVLGAAERMLEASSRELDKCVASEAALRRRYRL